MHSLHFSLRQDFESAIHNLQSTSWTLKIMEVLRQKIFKTLWAWEIIRSLDNMV